MPDALTIKRHVTTEELIQNDTQAPNIASEITYLVQDHLRWPVSECTSLSLEKLIFLEITSHTEVSYHDLWVALLRVKKDVLVFEVTVNDLLFMYVTQSKC